MILPFENNHLYSVHNNPYFGPPLIGEMMIQSDEKRAGPRLRSLTLLPLVLLVTAVPSGAVTQQRGTLDTLPEVANPAYERGSGPLVLIDEAHNNFHTAEGRYRAFAELLRRDGYRVEPNRSPFTLERLNRADILVIANALADENVENWDMPNPPGFSEREVEAVRKWVEQGGSLLLIADHMPFPAAAGNLAAAFGLLFMNGHASHADGRSPMKFNLSEGTLRDHAICRGRSPEERISTIASFTGQGFRLRPGTAGDPIMVLAEDVVIVLPERSWAISDTTQHISGHGFLQGAVLRYGEGRVAAFGEAAMFTIQSTGGNSPPFGMTHPEAPDNVQFVLNVLHWLYGLL